MNRLSIDYGIYFVVSGKLFELLRTLPNASGCIWFFDLSKRFRNLLCVLNQCSGRLSIIVLISIAVRTGTTFVIAERS